MRGDTSLAARLFLRGAGLGGTAVTIGGAALVVAALSAWSITSAQVTMLGEVDSRTVGTVRGVPAMWAGWVALAAGTVAVLAGPLLALGRGPSATRSTIAVVAALGFVAAAVTLALGPGSDAATSTDLAALAERLPVGVELQVDVATARGPWLAVAGAALTLAGCGGARER